ncbi:30S ribosomal protein S17 [Candidatus Shapirobacteria bacterium]|nr:30S ribosomal protein S17 [Candidatus Shapirobacteria bacterium]
MKQLRGTVIGNKVAKTAKVLVTRLKVHPLYQKRVKRRKIYQVIDEKGVKLGDEVRFQACRPASKTKKWRVTEIIKKEK